jgi:hypothetical protein
MRKLLLYDANANEYTTTVKMPVVSLQRKIKRVFVLDASSIQGCA